MDLSGFGGNFTSTLAATAVQQVASYLHKLAFAGDETAALKRVLEIALMRSVERTQPKELLQSDATAAEVADILGELFGTKLVAEALIVAALNGHGDARQLTALAIEAGLDPVTLPFDWNEFLMTFLEELERAIRGEVSSPDSKLRFRVAVSDLFQLRCSVAALAQTIDRAVERLTGGLIEIDPTERFNEFLLEYLGRSDHPKPFGGRRKDVEALNAWLEDSGESPKFLLVAPAGRGKSALLVHWARQLPQDIATVFIPVSIRFGTSQPMTFLPALANRLAHLHGKSLPEFARLDVEACRSIAIRYMKQPLPDGRRLVVIVDGLDEAGDRYSWAGQFPDDLPESVRYVVSARQLAGDHDGSGWMRRTGWETFSERVQLSELGGLTSDGVSEVLHNMGLPSEYAAAGNGIVANIHALTSGDPLLVGLYAEQIWKQYRSTGQVIWDATELRKFKAGLQGFFDKWYDDQRKLWGDKQPEPRVRAILTILSQVFGPLQASEVRELMRRGFAMDDWSLRDSMDTLSRFVIGDGKQNGYALSHPRLNEFFGAEPICDEQSKAKVHEAILSWGSDTLERLEQKQLDPKKVAHYLLSHLAEHYSANDIGLDKFSKLLGEGWIESWKVLDPTFRGFLADVQRVWDRASSAAKQQTEGTLNFHLGLQFRCMLCFGSIGSQYRLPAASIFAAAKDTGVISARQILSIIAYRVDGPDFEQVVEDIIPVIARDCGPALASLLEGRAPARARASLVKVQLLAKIARQLTDHEQSLVVDKARRAARDCEGDFERVCSALALLRFSREEKRKVELRRIVEQLATFKESRITPDILQDLIVEAPEAAVHLARTALEHYFTLTAYENKRSVRSLFALLDQERRRGYIEIVLARPIEYFLGENGDALYVVNPWLDTTQKLTLYSKISERPFRDQVIVLSKLGLRLDQATQIRLLEQTLAALRQQAISGALVFADWPAFVAIFDRPYRQTLLEALIEVIQREIASSTALSILGQIIGLLEEGQKLELSAVALAQGPRNHDEVPCLKMLGEAIHLLQPGERKHRQSRLAQRIMDFLNNETSLDEKSRLVLAPDLLPFMPGEAASAMAVVLCQARRDRNLKGTAWLAKVVPFLPDPARAAEAEEIRRNILNSEDKLVNKLLLDEAEAWLLPQEFEDLIGRRIAHAFEEPNGRQRAMELASLLKYAAKAHQHRLALYLITQAELELERDELWVNAISRVIDVEEPEWILDKVLPFVLELQHTSRSECVRLLSEIANRVEISTGKEILRAANEILPLEHWPRTSLLSVVPSLEGQSQRVVVAGTLRELAKKGRVYQLRMIPQLFQVLAGLGDDDAVMQSWDALWDVTEIWP